MTLRTLAAALILAACLPVHAGECRDAANKLAQVVPRDLAAMQSAVDMLADVRRTPAQTGHLVPEISALVLDNVANASTFAGQMRGAMYPCQASDPAAYRDADAQLRRLDAAVRNARRAMGG